MSIADIATGVSSCKADRRMALIKARSMTFPLAAIPGTARLIWSNALYDAA